MVKTKKNTLWSVVVLAAISLFSVLLIICVKDLLPPNENHFVRVKLEAICPATDYTTLTDEQLKELDVSLVEFNATLSRSKINSVYRAIGGANDGCYIIESVGNGFSSAPITLYVAYDSEGVIIGVVDVAVDAGNTFWKEVLVAKLDDIYASLIGKSEDIGTGEDILADTGATRSLDGVARAVNAANKLVAILLGNAPDIPQPGQPPVVVTDAGLLAKLRALTTGESNFYRYSYASSDSIGGFMAEIHAVYVGSDFEIIFEASCTDAGDFGSAKILVLVDIEQKSIIKINPISLSVANKGTQIISEQLNDMAELTRLFGGYKLADVVAMGKYLDGATGATEIADALKTAVTGVLMKIDAFMEEWGDKLEALEPDELPNPDEPGDSDIDTETLEKLKEMSVSTSFIRYEYADTQVFNSYKSGSSENDMQDYTAEIKAVYVGNKGDVIIEVESNGTGKYGITRLLVSVDVEKKEVKKVNYLYMSIRNQGTNIVTDYLFDMEVLTAMFEGCKVSDIEGMEKQLDGQTSATQIANGLKVAVAGALMSIDDINTALNAELGGND